MKSNSKSDGILGKVIFRFFNSMSVSFKEGWKSKRQFFRYSPSIDCSSIPDEVPPPKILYVLVDIKNYGVSLMSFEIVLKL